MASARTKTVGDDAESIDAKVWAKARTDAKRLPVAELAVFLERVHGSHELLCHGFVIWKLYACKATLMRLRTASSVSFGLSSTMHEPIRTL